MVLLESLGHDVADHVGDSRHALRQVFGAEYRRRALGEEELEQAGQCINPTSNHCQATVVVQLRQPHHPDRLLLSIQIPAELEIVGQQQVWQRLAVAHELLAIVGTQIPWLTIPLDLAQVDVAVLGFHIANRLRDSPALAACPRNHEIRRAAGDALGLVCGRDTYDGAFQQRLERRPVRVLRGVAGGQVGTQLSEVGAEGVWGRHGASCPPVAANPRMAIRRLPDASSRTSIGSDLPALRRLQGQEKPFRN